MDRLLELCQPVIGLPTYLTLTLLPVFPCGRPHLALPLTHAPPVACALFVARSLTYRNPVVDLRALANRNFALGCVLSFVTGIGIFTTIYLTPLFLGYVRGFSAWQTGIAIFSTGAMMVPTRLLIRAGPPSESPMRLAS